MRNHATLFSFPAAMVLVLASFSPAGVAQEPSEGAAPAAPAGEGRVIVKSETSVPEDVRQQFETGFEWGESQAEKESEAKSAADAQAENERLQAELEQAKKEAEQAKAEAESARKEAAEQAKAAEEARTQAEAQFEAANEARRQADAEAKKREEQELKRAEAETARKATEEKAAAAAKPSEQAEAASADSINELEPDAEAETEPAAAVQRVRPEGSIASIEINPNSEVDGARGIAVSVSANASRIKGTRLETAVYFFDAAGKPLADTDREFRSSQGQVYVGEYRTADSEPYQWTEDLFVPIDQLHSGAPAGQNIKAEVIVWEYSDRRGQVLARSEMESITVQAREVKSAAQIDIAGAWSDGVTIAVNESTIAVEGLDVRGTVENADWTLSGSTLTGVLTIGRRVGTDRVATYEFIVSDDGNTLTGTYTITGGESEEIKDEGAIVLTR